MINFVKSTRRNKKYMVYYNEKWIHFGDINYQQFKDKTNLKLYSNLDHNDEKRRKNYLNRSMGIKDKNGKYTYLDRNSPNYYSVKYLW